MTKYTEDEMRLAREIGARHDDNKAYQYLDGSRDSYPDMLMILAAIRETTNKAAQYVSVYDHDAEGALYSGEHLK